MIDFHQGELEEREEAIKNIEVRDEERDKSRSYIINTLVGHGPMQRNLQRPGHNGSRTRRPNR